MARRIGLREFQLSVAERLRTAATRATVASRLGFQVGGVNWFVPLHLVSEVIPVPQALAVPLTHAWFRGVPTCAATSAASWISRNSRAGSRSAPAWSGA